MPRPSVCDFTQLQVCVHVGTRPQANCTLLYFNDMLAKKTELNLNLNKVHFFLLLQSKVNICTGTWDIFWQMLLVLHPSVSEQCALQGPQTQLEQEDVERLLMRPVNAGCTVTRCRRPPDPQCGLTFTPCVWVCERVHALLFWHAVLPSDKFSLL